MERVYFFYITFATSFYEYDLTDYLNFISAAVHINAVHHK